MEHTNNMRKQFFLSFAWAVITFLATLWTAKYIYAAGFAQSICFFALTFHLLQHFKSKGKEVYAVTSAIVAGRVLPEIPVRIITFYDSLGSIGILIMVTVTILLAALYQQKRLPVILILTIIIVILLGTAGIDTWYDFVKYLKK